MVLTVSLGSLLNLGFLTLTSLIIVTPTYYSSCVVASFLVTLVFLGALTSVVVSLTFLVRLGAFVVSLTFLGALALGFLT